jgi:hypothetical protein
MCVCAEINIAPPVMEWQPVYDVEKSENVTWPA